MQRAVCSYQPSRATICGARADATLSGTERRTKTRKKNQETILKLARSKLPEKQKTICAGRQHC